MNVANRELISEVSWPTVCNNQLINTYTFTNVILHLRDMSLAGRFSYILSPQRLDFVGWWVIWMEFQMEIYLTACCSLFVNAHCIVLSWSPRQVRLSVLFSSREERLEILLSMSTVK